MRSLVRLTVLATAAASLLACSAWRQQLPGDPLEVRLEPLPFNPTDSSDLGSDALRFVSLHLLRGGRPEFGGFSGMALEGRELSAVSDHGYWWHGHLELDGDYRLRAFSDNRLGPLHDLNGRPMAKRERRDAEELAPWPGGLLVSFEGDHRVVWYRRPARLPLWRALADRRPARLVTPQDLLSNESNGGIEAMTRLSDGRLLLVAETRKNEQGHHLAWLGAPSSGRWERISLLGTEDFVSTSATTLPNGDVLLLQRSYTPERGVRGRICRVAGDLLTSLPARRGPIEPVELLRIGAPHNVDNFESIDVLRTDEGRTFVFVMADENYSDQQRTLFLQLELLAAGA